MATYNLMNEQVTTNDAEQAISTAPITSSTSNSSGSLTSATTGASTAITPSQMQNVTPITTPTLDTTTTNTNTNGLIAGTESANKSLADITKSLYSEPTEAEKAQKSILDSITSLTAQDTGKAQYAIEQENKLGIPELKTQISDLNSQVLIGLADLNKMQADFDKANLELAQQPQQLSSVVGSAQQENMRTYAITRASKAAEIGLIQARQAALGGQLETAYALADRAVTAKYAPIEDELKVKRAQLDAIAPFLAKDEAIRAEALRRQYTAEQQNIEDEKAKQKQYIKLALESRVTSKYFNYAGTIIRTSDGHAFSTPEEFFKDSGATSWQDPRLTTLVSDYKPVAQASDTEIVTVGGNKVLINSQTGETIKSLGSSSEGSGGNSVYKFSTDDKGRLIAAGISSTDISQIQTLINQGNSIEDIGGITDAQKKVLTDLLKGVTPTQANQTTTIFLNKDYFKNLYTTSQLEKAAADAGFGDLGEGLFNLKDVDTEAYLNYLEKLVAQYRQAGYNDQEILKMMQ